MPHIENLFQALASVFWRFRWVAAADLFGATRGSIWQGVCNTTQGLPEIDPAGLAGSCLKSH